MFLQCCDIACDSEFLCGIWFGVFLYYKLSVLSAVPSTEGSLALPQGASSLKAGMRGALCRIIILSVRCLKLMWPLDYVDFFFNLTKPHSHQQNCMLNSSKNTTVVFLQICRKPLPKTFDVKLILSIMLNVKNTMARGCWRLTFHSEYIDCSQTSQMQRAGSTLQLTGYLFLDITGESHSGPELSFGCFQSLGEFSANL